MNNEDQKEHIYDFTTCQRLYWAALVKTPDAAGNNPVYYLRIFDRLKRCDKFSDLSSYRKKMNVTIRELGGDPALLVPKFYGEESMTFSELSICRSLVDEHFDDNSHALLASLSIKNRLYYETVYRWDRMVAILGGGAVASRYARNYIKPWNPKMMQSKQQSSSSEK